LITCLMDQNKNVTIAKIVPSGKYYSSGSNEFAIEFTQDMLDSGETRDVHGRGGVRGSAAEALGKLGDKRAVKPLTACLKDQDEDVRLSAAEALGKLRPPPAGSR
jgi:HEAT repeat protein